MENPRTPVARDCRISSITKLPEKIIPKKEIVESHLREVFIEILPNKATPVRINIVKYMANPYQQAGYPKK